MTERFAGDIAAAIAQGVALDALTSDVRPQRARIVAEPRIRAARRVVFAASGDSRFASMRMVPAFRRWSSAFAQAPASRAFSRHGIPLAGSSDALVAVSPAGATARGVS